MSSNLNLSFEGIGEMLRADFMIAEMHRRAEVGKAFAEATAPSDVHDKDGVYYRDFFAVGSGVREGKTRRAYGELRNDHPAALPIEVGTRRTPAHHTLLRALDVMGSG